MRRVLIQLAFLSFLLASCAPIQDRRTLNYMEALMPERPDSALAVLRGLQPWDLPGLHVRPLHALLLSEALDKNYIDLIDDSLAMAAHHYYGDHGSKLHRLKSWYYLGRIRFNAGNYAEAVICYDKALEYAETLENYHYMGLINREIANALDHVWDTWHAVDRLRTAVSCFQMADEKKYADYCKFSIASGLWKLKQFDESREVLDGITDVQDDKYLSSKVAEMRFYLAMADEKSTTDDLLSEYERYSPFLASSPTAAKFSEAAFVHQLAGNVDSSDFYLSKAIELSATSGDSLVVNSDIARIAADRGDFKTAYEKLLQTFQSQDSSVFGALKQSVYFYQGTYYHNESRINSIRAKLRTQTYGILLFLLIVAASLLLYRNRRQRSVIIEELTRTVEIRQELAAIKNENKGMEQAIAVLFENRTRILQILSEKYSLVENLHRKGQKEKRLSKDEIIASFRSSMLELRKDDRITSSMEEVLNYWKGGIMQKFRDFFGDNTSSGIRMSKDELELLPYFISGMPYKTISYLTGISVPSLRVRKTRIRAKVSSLDDVFAREKQLFLNNLETRY